MRALSRLRFAAFTATSLALASGLFACSKFGRLTVAEKAFTTVKFSRAGGRSAARSGGVHSLYTPQTGGVIIWGISAGSPAKTFSLVLDSDTNEATKDQLPVGNWTFYAAGWEGSSGNKLVGLVRCAKREMAGATVFIGNPPGKQSGVSCDAKGYRSPARSSISFRLPDGFLFP